MQEIEKLVEAWKKEVLSAVCLNGCDHICCSMNYDIDNEEHLGFMFGIIGSIEAPKNSSGTPLFWKRDDAEEKGGMFRTNFSTGRDYCPKYDGKCRIYTHELRPDICASYPLGVNSRRKVVVYDSLCRAMVPENLSLLVSQAGALGYTVMNIKDAKNNGLREIGKCEIPEGNGIVLAG